MKTNTVIDSKLDFWAIGTTGNFFIPADIHEVRIMRNGNRVCSMPLVRGDSDSIESAQANAAFIVTACNNYEALFQMVRDLKNCVQRLTQDNVSQYDRDTEAQWEGEAHELLTRINPNYYKNANE